MHDHGEEPRFKIQIRIYRNLTKSNTYKIYIYILHQGQSKIQVQVSLRVSTFGKVKEQSLDWQPGFGTDWWLMNALD